MTYIVVSENEIVKAEMERPSFSAWEIINPCVNKDRLIKPFQAHCLSLPRIPIKGKHKWEVWQEVPESEVRLEDQFWTGSVWWPTIHLVDGKVKPGTKTRIVAIPIQPTPEGEKVDERLNVVDYLTKRITELKRIDASFCNVRWDMSKHKIERDLARDMSNETTARRHELEDLLNLLTNDNTQTQ